MVHGSTQACQIPSSTEDRRRTKVPSVGTRQERRLHPPLSTGLLHWPLRRIPSRPLGADSSITASLASSNDVSSMAHSISHAGASASIQTHGERESHCSPRSTDFEPGSFSNSLAAGYSSRGQHLAIPLQRPSEILPPFSNLQGRRHSRPVYQACLDDRSAGPSADQYSVEIQLLVPSLPRRNCQHSKVAAPRYRRSCSIRRACQPRQGQGVSHTARTRSWSLRTQ